MSLGTYVLASSVYQNRIPPMYLTPNGPHVVNVLTNQELLLRATLSIHIQYSSFTSINYVSRKRERVCVSGSVWKRISEIN
ncbi:hypothetical protein YC2023_081493 [Brassica napus]